MRNLPDVIFAGEREDLIKQLECEYFIAEKEFTEKAQTTVELANAAANTSHVAERHLLLALDYKLRHTPNTAARVEMLKAYQRLLEELVTLRETPRENMGSLAGMMISAAMVNLQQQQTAVWLLDADTEKRWKRIANVPLLLNGKTIQLTDGKAKFKTLCHYFKKRNHS